MAFPKLQLQLTLDICGSHSKKWLLISLRYGMFELSLSGDISQARNLSIKEILFYPVQAALAG